MYRSLQHCKTHLDPQRHLELVQAQHLLHCGGRLSVGRVLLIGQHQHGDAKQLPARQRSEQRRPRLLKPAHARGLDFTAGVDALRISAIVPFSVQPPWARSSSLIGLQALITHTEDYPSKWRPPEDIR